MRGVLLVLLAAGALGCSGVERQASGAERSTPDAPRATPDAERSTAIDSLMGQVIPAVAVTLAVEATPERADSILADNGFTLDRFEATLYTIAADSAASQLFESALGR
jgi:hypothetical protein